MIFDLCNELKQCCEERNFCGMNLSGADLSKIRLINADLSEADLSGADLSEVCLIGADLSGANLGGTDLSEAYLKKADLRNANLSNADLGEAYLADANLSGANLSAAILHRADLGRTDLSKCTLRWTCLDPNQKPNQLHANKFQQYKGLLVGYRTYNSEVMDEAFVYQPGKFYRAPVFSTCPMTDCHPGLYVNTSRKNLTDIMVLFAKEHLHSTSIKHRVKGFYVWEGNLEGK